MSDENDGTKLFERGTVEFVTVAAEFCMFLEKVEIFHKQASLEKLQKLIPLLYLKGSLLPVLESRTDAANEKFVTEDEWFHIRDLVALKLGSHDAYQASVDPVLQDTDEPVGGAISEDMADVYQELKDFITLYNIGTEEIMNDALWECRENFNAWGGKLLNALKAVHQVLYSGESLDDQEQAPGCKLWQDEEDLEEMDTDSWIISQRMKDWKDDGEPQQ